MRRFTLREAVLADVPAVVRLHHLTLETSLPFLPVIHTVEEGEVFFRDVVFARGEVWVAEASGEIVGYSAFREDWLDHLYVHPQYHGSGIGSELLAKARMQYGRLQAWVFQKNHAAIAFYESKGFTCVRTTDGRDNEEREPAALYVWKTP